MFPMSLDEKIPFDSPVRLVNQIVDKLILTLTLFLTPIREAARVATTLA